MTFFNAQATFKALDSAGHSPLCPFRPDRLSANRHTHCRDSLWSRSQLYILQQQQQLYCIFRFTILRSNIQSLWLQRDRSKPYSRHWPQYRTVSFVTSILYISVQISFLTSFFFSSICFLTHRDIAWILDCIKFNAEAVWNSKVPCWIQHQCHNTSGTEQKNSTKTGSTFSKSDFDFYQRWIQ